MPENKAKPRCVIVFDTEDSCKEFCVYAGQKGFLDIKNFFTVSAKHCMSKYPLKTGAADKDV